MPEGKPFPLNTWYAAAWGHEIKHELVARTICEKDIVLYRRGDGTVTALEDACWHRLLPLSLGRLKGDEKTLHEYLEKIVQSADRMSALIRDVLAYSRAMASIPLGQRGDRDHHSAPSALLVVARITSLAGSAWAPRGSRSGNGRV